MALDSLILVVNPGSASRKYALYRGETLLTKVHFEVIEGQIFYTTSQQTKPQPANISHISFACTQLLPILKREVADFDPKDVATAGIRVVAPSTYFQQSRRFSKSVLERLKELEAISPLHIQATLSEYLIVQREFPKTVLFAISDSEALADKPDKAMYYGLPFADSQKLDIKRFGYHGLSFNSAIASLKSSSALAQRTIICHLGGGASVAAVQNGKILDSTMGFSPLEGLVMATRSGTVDVEAYEYLKQQLQLSNKQLYDYLNSKSGLLGVSGLSSDIRELLAAEADHEGAKRALKMYVYKVQQAIGSMAAVMGGADSLVFTGTVGERSREIRRRITANLLYLGFSIHDNHNTHLKEVHKLSRPGSPATIYVVPADEESQMARMLLRLK